MKPPKYHVAYAGLDTHTWQLLIQEPAFVPKIVAHIPALTDRSTSNPVNLLFKYVYRTYYTKQRVSSLAGALKLCSPLLSSVWRKYYVFLLSVITLKVKIIDFTQVQQTQSAFQAEAIDVLIVNIWDMLPAEIIDTPTYKTVNVHPSKLPQYRGAVPTLMTLKNHDSESAVSYIILTKGMDNGDLIGQHVFVVSPQDTYLTLETKITHIIKQTLVKDVLHYASGEHSPVPQSIIGSSTTPRYYDYMPIDWETETAEDIYNKINAYPYLEPFDYCYTFFDDGTKVYIRGATLFPPLPNTTAQPGTYLIRGLTLRVVAKSGIITCKLVRDITVKQSLYLALHRQGRFIMNKEKHQ